MKKLMTIAAASFALLLLVAAPSAEAHGLSGGFSGSLNLGTKLLRADADSDIRVDAPLVGGKDHEDRKDADHEDQDDDRGGDDEVRASNAEIGDKIAVAGKLQS